MVDPIPISMIMRAAEIAPAGDLDGDDQAGVGVEGGDVSLVELDGASGDGQSEADAAAGSVAVPLDAEERLEDVGEGLARDARPVVADGDLGMVAVAGELDLDDAARRGVPDGVAQDVLAGAPEQLAVAGHDQGALGGERQSAVARVGLEGAIGDELLEQLGQVNVLDVAGAGVAFGAG